MRTFKDRIRHVVLFEMIALIIVATAGAWIVDRSVFEMGTLGIAFSVLVMIWNLIYNFVFDLWERRYRDEVKRGVGLRIVHALLFEAGILLFGVFLVAWWLKMTLWQALIMDVGFAVFFVAYAFVYNWIYDIVFPVPGRGPEEQAV